MVFQILLSGMKFLQESRASLACLYKNFPVDISGTVVGESPDCLLLSGTVVGENPDHVCWVQVDFASYNSQVLTFGTLHSLAPLEVRIDEKSIFQDTADRTDRGQFLIESALHSLGQAAH